MRKLIQILTVLLLLIPSQAVFAQDTTPTPSGPVYIVQSGDNLITIASRFGITMDDLIAANELADPNQLKIGDELTIPGMKDVQGYLVTKTVGFGSTLSSLSIQNKVPEEKLIQLNRITSPAELYTGVDLIIPEQENTDQPARHYLVESGQSLLEFAVLANTNPWDLQQVNELSGDWDVISGQGLILPSKDTADVKGLATSPTDNVSISPLPLVQGKTIAITVNTDAPATLSGSLTDHQLHFLQNGDNRYTALQGIYAMQDPGIYPLDIQVRLEDGSEMDYEQMVIIEDGQFPNDPVINVKDEFIDPSITQPELDWLTQQIAPVTPEKYWEGIWTSPSPYDYHECMNSGYGNRRSYNGGPYDSFHTGVDFCGGEGVKIYAPTRGKVIFAGLLTVRGNATIIDHGWGVYSCYFHQSAIEVSVGDMVQSGQEIGLIGGTGRVTGAHLHWEVWVGGVQVNPLEWLQNEYPPQS